MPVLARLYHGPPWREARALPLAPTRWVEAGLGASHDGEHRPATWRDALPQLEVVLSKQLRAYRRSMRSHGVGPDYRSDLDLRRRAGAWSIGGDTRIDERGTTFEFSLFVRCARNQLAVWEGHGVPDALRPNFSPELPGTPPTSSEVLDLLATSLRQRGITDPLPKR